MLYYQTNTIRYPVQICSEYRYSILMYISTDNMTCDKVTTHYNVSIYHDIISVQYFYVTIVFYSLIGNMFNYIMMNFTGSTILHSNNIEITLQYNTVKPRLTVLNGTKKVIHNWIGLIKGKYYLVFIIIIPILLINNFNIMREK